MDSALQSAAGCPRIYLSIVDAFGRRTAMKDGPYRKRGGFFGWRITGAAGMLEFDVNQDSPGWRINLRVDSGLFDP
jgi:hypothetical protein